MSALPQPRRSELSRRASVFAALGDATRLDLVGRLADGAPRSISLLAEGSSLTRQAVAKHLRVLEGSGLVRSRRTGRETLFVVRPEALADAGAYLARVSAQWDDALARLKSLVER
jgi:DNA-binding transcriptional ArsR family regulator